MRSHNPRLRKETAKKDKNGREILHRKLKMNTNPPKTGGVLR